MGLSGKAKSSSEGWGLGLLLVLFPDDDNDDDKYVDKKKKLSSSPSCSFKSIRCNSNNNLIISKAQSTISICALIVFFTLLCFTLCTFEPTTKFPSNFPRRWLSENPRNYKYKNNNISSSSSWFVNIWRRGVNEKISKNKSRHFSSSSSSSDALQGMGTLFRRGTKAMSDLVVAHLMEDTKYDDLRLFLRTLHRSGLTAKSDIVFIFPSLSSIVSSNFSAIIQEENESFLKLVHCYRKNKNDSVPKSVTSFDVTQFVDKKDKQGGGEPLWGRRRIHSNYSSQESEEDFFTESSWGSVVGFEAAELDPEDSLSGFLDSVPMGLRRWACYPMLLGRLRRNFKHLLLVDVKDVVILSDPVARVRNRSPESVLLSTIETAVVHSGKHNRKNSGKTQAHNQKESKLPINPAVIMGGMRGIRRLSSAMLTEIVRATIERRSKTNPISESGILNQLVRNDSLLKTININTRTESIPDTSSLASPNYPKSSSIVHHGGGNSNVSLNSIIQRDICSSLLDSSVYKDC